MKRLKKMIATLCAIAMTTALTAPMALADLVSKDGTTGEITFDPTAIVGPVETAIIATVTSIVGIVVIAIGLKWLFRLIKRAG